MRLVALAVVLTGCISIPPFHGASDAGSDAAAMPDAPAGPLAVRWIRNAYRDGGADTTATGSPMMSSAGYGIQTSGIVDGDLVLFIGNVDNGAAGFWHLPTGFTQIVQNYYGQDGQTYVVGWKIAAGEPIYYTGTYTMGVSSSAAATISLLAVTGYAPALPIETYQQTDHQAATDPADVGSAGITTTADNSLLIFAAGADWTPNNGMNMFQAPSDFQVLTEIGDRQTHWDWTSQALAYKYQAQAGPSGPLTSTLTATSYPDGATHIPGGGWSVLFAIAPRPL